MFKTKYTIYNFFFLITKRYLWASCHVIRYLSVPRFQRLCRIPSCGFPFNRSLLKDTWAAFHFAAVNTHVHVCLIHTSNPVIQDKHTKPPRSGLLVPSFLLLSTECSSRSISMPHSEKALKQEFGALLIENHDFCVACTAVYPPNVCMHFRIHSKLQR